MKTKTPNSHLTRALLATVLFATGAASAAANPAAAGAEAETIGATGLPGSIAAALNAPLSGNQKDLQDMVKAPVRESIASVDKKTDAAKKADAAAEKVKPAVKEAKEALAKAEADAKNAKDALAKAEADAKNAKDAAKKAKADAGKAADALEEAESADARAKKVLARAKKDAEKAKTALDRLPKDADAKIRAAAKKAAADAADALAKAEAGAKDAAVALDKADKTAKKAAEDARTAVAGAKKAAGEADKAVAAADAASDALAGAKNASEKADRKAASDGRAKVRKDLRKAKLDLERAKLERASAEERERFAKNRAKIDAEKDPAKKTAALEKWRADLKKAGIKEEEVKNADGAVSAAQDRINKAYDELNQAEHAYYKEFPGQISTHVAELTAAEADAVLAPYERAQGKKFKGDRRWLAGAEVNGRRIVDAFRAGTSFETAKKEALSRAAAGGFYFAGFALDDTDGTILVDKGRIGSVHVKFVDENGKEIAGPDAGAFFSPEQIEHYFSRGRAIDAIEDGGTFNFGVVKERFTQLNGHPDVAKADISFRPTANYQYKYEDGTEGPKNRAVDMDVLVTEKKGVPLHGVVGIDDFGSMEGSDRWMARATVQHLNLWGADHALTLNGNVSFGGSLWGVAGSYYVPDIWDRFNLTVHGGYTDVDQDDVVRDIDVEGTGYFAGLQASGRLYDSGRSTLSLSVGATWRHVDSALVVDGTKYEQGDGYEIVPLSVALLYADKVLDSWGGRNYATLEGVCNVAGSGVEDLRATRFAIDEDRYMLARLQLARLQMLGDYEWKDASGLWMLFGKFDGQVASTDLVGAEQFGIGGHGSIRGFLEREYMGDSGFAATLELRTPVLVGLLSSLFGAVNDSNRLVYGWDRLQFVGFADFGYYLLNDGAGSGRDDDDFLASLGLGFRMAVREDALLRFDWGFPVAKPDDSDTSSSGTGHVALQFQF